jgi:hypothetical protein
LRPVSRHERVGEHNAVVCHCVYRTPDPVLSDEVCGVGMTDAALGAGKAIRDQAQDQIQREILVRVCP